MIRHLKDMFFFPVASYFAFFAKIRLNKWKPQIVVVTGSSGKTTLFSLIESQVGTQAHYSHHANSAIGVPFDILDLHRKTLTLWEWPALFLKAPTQAFKKPYSEKIYVVECDADRPGEAKFLSNLLQPTVTLWISTSRTHSMNFDRLVPHPFSSVEKAIAHEFGYFLEKTSQLVVLNGDSKLMEEQKTRAKAKTQEVRMKQLTSYTVTREGTEFKIENSKIHFKSLQPKEIFYAIEMTKYICEFLDITFDPGFKNFSPLPGRSTLFRGVKNITIIDSTYNANLSSVSAILNMYGLFPAKEKWIVLGDMLEQGNEEQEEHEKLADLVVSLAPRRIVLLGPRVKRYAYPILQKKLPTTPIAAFESPKEVLDYLKEYIKGGETILFKGARFLEGVIENLLLDKKEKQNLARREKVWEKRRKKWGL